MTERPKKKILKIDPYLMPYEDAINQRVDQFKKKKKELVGTRGKLTDFANGYL